MYATREHLEEAEYRRLAPYATKSRESRGRAHPVPEHDYRTAFQRDCHRIVHTTAFRRLEYKTQVFVNYEGDHYRTRLTHTIEVGQIARTIARALLLNEDLTEAIAMAHDLGHTPFGHAGERALNEIMQGRGGFNHNFQSLRIVEELERRYQEFPGLNLTWEVREGIVKHTTAYDASDARDYEPELQSSLEAQVVNVADEIAYNAHDVDDGLRAGLIEPQRLAKTRLWKESCARLGLSATSLGELERRSAIRELINAEVTDVLRQTGRTLSELGIDSPELARRQRCNMVTFSPEMAEMNRELRGFLGAHMYRHYRVVRMTVKAQRLINALFEAFLAVPSQLPETTQLRLQRGDAHRVICDYIAGMTDRFALEEYCKLYDPEERT